ncbi:MAG TPA: homogentisate phytyltransferase [Phnomibacter sp.]|nr:homogentisate phytyltransferase [Phnomibacter sp.]
MAQTGDLERTSHLITNTLKAWWAFSRPHTIIGSFFSITSLFLIAAALYGSQSSQPVWDVVDHYTWQYLITLLSALACNLFIVGLNQWQDLEVDRINKPWLPLAAGSISLRQAKLAVWSSLLLSLVTSSLLGWWFFLLILLINLIGAAYSLPPLKLKRHHLPAAFAIVLVRGLLVNLGMSAHFMQQMGQPATIPEAVWPLALFIVGFSFGIAWFKDIPDTEGDEKFHFKTLAVSMNRQTALWLGVAVVGLSYVAVSASPFVLLMPVQTAFFSLSHLALGLLFIYRSARLNLDNPSAVKQFYMFFWLLFFVEYIIYPLSFLIA